MPAKLRLNECALVRRDPIQVEHGVVCCRLVGRDSTPHHSDAVEAWIEFPRQLLGERSGTDISREPVLVSLSTARSSTTECSS